MILFLLSAVWIIRIVTNLLSYVHLWYVKEYRADRMFIHLRTNQGKRLLFLPWKRPPLSPKSVFIFGVSLFVLAGLFVYIPVNTLVKLFILDLFSFPITFILVIFSGLPTALYHRFLIKKSIQVLQAHKKMMVVGITGSYGKTSTKEILYTLLSQKFQTLKTEASKNSPIAIAELLLTKLKSEHEVFIVEMGAYTKGEIAQMCGMVHPQIGIVTAINAQHQDLFGSLENTMKAKYELVQGLSGKRVSIFNADNSYTQKMAGWAKRDGCAVRYYSMQKKSEPDEKTTCRATEMTSTVDGITFTAQYDKQKKRIAADLLGSHQVGNVLAAMTAAISCGMSFAEVAAACRHIHPLEKIMQRTSGVRGSLFIDDTFNNNPDAAFAAIDFLRGTSARKILVFQPMIELGTYAHESHKNVGAYAARVCDDILLTNDNFYTPFMEGVSSVSPHKKVNVFSADAAADYIKKTVKKGDTVLFKGKESGRVLASLNASGV